ncbi:MAG: energy transducer TonB [Candidatus Acidiferrales bacterium]
MRRGVILCAILLLSSGAFAQETKPANPLPDQFEIGTYTFSDVGATENYDILVVKGREGQDASVQKVSLTPAHACVLPAKLEVASGFSQSIPELLGGLNPCAIPEAELDQELKPNGRRPRLSYSGIAMRVQCGGQTRVIRSDILDRDAKPLPAWDMNRTWTQQLLLDLSMAVPRAANKAVPIGLNEGQISAGEPDSEELRDLWAGKYDALFPNAPDKPSELYRAAQEPLPRPTIRLVSSEPVAPEILILPVYPRLARLTRTEGAVSFHFEIDPTGRITNLIFESGDSFLLRPAVAQVVNRWSFPETAAGHQVHATIEFETNCPRQLR